MKLRNYIFYGKWYAHSKFYASNTSEKKWGQGHVYNCIHHFILIWHDTRVYIFQESPALPPQLAAAMSLHFCSHAGLRAKWILQWLSVYIKSLENWHYKDNCFCFTWWVKMLLCFVYAGIVGVQYLHPLPVLTACWPCCLCLTQV